MIASSAAEWQDELKPYKAGEAWSAGTGTLVGEQNGSAATARVFTTSLLPRGTGR
jgi:hypothetical protein